MNLMEHHVSVYKDIHNPKPTEETAFKAYMYGYMEGHARALEVTNRNLKDIYMETGDSALIPYCMGSEKALNIQKGWFNDAGTILRKQNKQIYLNLREYSKFCDRLNKRKEEK